MSSFLLSQILIFFAFCFDLISFQLKKREQILLCFIAASSLIGLHFVLLKQETAAYLVFVSTLRFITFYFSTNRTFLYLFLFINTCVLFLTYYGALSVIAYMAGFIGTFASFQKNDKLMRQGMMLCTSLWIAHNSLAGSPAATALEAFFLGSNAVGYYRFYLRQPQVIKREH
jgi:hypothetical protein